MANIFAPGGNELLNKKEFDSKVNVDTPLFRELQDSNSWQHIFGKNGSFNGLVAFRSNQMGLGITMGWYSTGIAFSGNDTKGALSVNYNTHQHQAMISGGNNNSSWHEYIAWKSDIDALKARIDALEKQIGGNK